jgi:predicted glycoside hydrolase/deacetylase ChbG (UPF0249 family)
MGGSVNGQRYLIVTADDFGIGPATSQGILDLGAAGHVTCSVLLVTSPHAETSVKAWRRAREALELGWHPCLTLDRPILPASQVPSLVGDDGCFWTLGNFVKRNWLGRIRPAEMEIELAAQYQRFCELVGHPPTVINFHHHLQIFRPVGKILQSILDRQQLRPYVRRVREPLTSLAPVPGARGKRAFLSLLGRSDAARFEAAGFPGNDWLAGVTDPQWVTDPDFLVRWLRQMPGQVVELTCHPGYLDDSLIGRDCPSKDDQWRRRGHELNLLCAPSFQESCARSGFRLISPTLLARQSQKGPTAHAA